MEAQRTTEYCHSAAVMAVQNDPRVRNYLVGEGGATWAILGNQPRTK